MCEIDVRLRVGLGLGVEVDGVLRDLRGLPADQHLGLLPLVVEDPQPQPVRIGALRDHVLLALDEGDGDRGRSRPAGSPSGRVLRRMPAPASTGGVSVETRARGLRPQSGSGASWMRTSLPSLAGRLLTKRIEQLNTMVRSTWSSCSETSMTFTRRFGPAPVTCAGAGAPARRAAQSSSGS